jgi:hypothetical protein
LSDPQADYLYIPAEDEFKTLVVVFCKACKREIGHYDEVDGQVWLHIGNVDVQFASGRCTCGEAWEWTASAIALERLIGRRRRLFADAT